MKSARKLIRVFAFNDCIIDSIQDFISNELLPIHWYYKGFSKYSTTSLHALIRLNDSKPVLSSVSPAKFAHS